LDSGFSHFVSGMNDVSSDDYVLIQTYLDIAGASYVGQATTFAFVSIFLFVNPFISPHSWANEICADDDQERGIVLASMKSVIVIYYFRCS